MKKLVKVLAISFLVGLTLTGCKDEEAKDDQDKVKDGVIDQLKDDYLSSVDVDYAYEFTKSLEEFKTNEKLGYRTAGSEAELKTGEKLDKKWRKSALQK